MTVSEPIASSSGDCKETPQDREWIIIAAPRYGESLWYFEIFLVLGPILTRYHTRHIEVSHYDTCLLNDEHLSA